MNEQELDLLCGDLSRENRILQFKVLELERKCDSIRNQTLEEIAQRFDQMPFGDTVTSFAIFVRNMKT
jgi:hypothetical protein